MKGVFKLKNKLSILFYVFAIIFLIITIYLSVDGFINLANSASEYGVSIVDEWATILKSILATAGGFLGFSILFLGIGLILGKLSK